MFTYAVRSQYQINSNEIRKWTFRDSTSSCIQDSRFNDDELQLNAMIFFFLLLPLLLLLLNLNIFFDKQKKKRLFFFFFLVIQILSTHIM